MCGRECGQPSGLNREAEPRNVRSQAEPGNEDVAEPWSAVVIGVFPMSENGLYAQPREVTELSDCWFYHTADIPGHGCVQGQWDLRPNIDRYLGGVNFHGKRVLDVGAASGFLTFNME